MCLSGGSAFGLAACDGVMAWLARRNVGFPVGSGKGEVVPIVPGAVVFDLGRGDFGHRPTAAFGRLACDAADAGPHAIGAVGAGAGTLAGGLKGGVGSASTTLPDGTLVSAIAVVNAAGHVIDRATGLPFHAAGLPIRLKRPSAADRKALVALVDAARRPLNTTIGVVATSARLTKAECTKMASVAHDGLARAVRPAHSLNDGDTIFAIATGHGELAIDASDPTYRSASSRPAALNAVFEAAAECFATACTLGVVAATSIGGFLSYRDVCPSAFAGGPGSAALAH